MNNSSPKNLDCWSVRRQETKIIGRWKKRRKGGTKIVAALYLVPSRNCDSMELRFNRYVIKTCFPRFSSLVNPPPPPPPPIIALMRLSRYTLERKGNGTMIDYYSLRAIYALNIPRWGLDRFRRDLFLFDEEIKKEGGKKKEEREYRDFIVDAWVEINFLETESLIDISLEKEEKEEEGEMCTLNGKCGGKPKWASFFFFPFPFLTLFVRVRCNFTTSSDTKLGV